MGAVFDEWSIYVSPAKKIAVLGVALSLGMLLQAKYTHATKEENAFFFVRT